MRSFQFLFLFCIVYTLTASHSFAAATADSDEAFDQHDRELSGVAEGGSCRVAYVGGGNGQGSKYVETGNNKCGDDLLCQSDGKYKEYRKL